jgi:3-phosphoshikimate 1-carboxyvinyltransferase
MPVASAQVKSSVLLAGMYAQGTTAVTEPGPSRDHTERMLRARGVAVRSDGLTHTLEGPAPAMSALDVRVPGDFSSAAYLIVAALLVPGSEIVIENVGLNPTRTGLLDMLLAMGAQIAEENPRDEGGEPVADLRVRTSSLRGITAGGDLVPRAIDEFPILALAATQAEGETHIRDAAELRVKETDRIATTVEALRALGAQIEAVPDGFDIMGPTPLTGATADSHDDHRLGMTIAVAGLIARGETVVLGAERIVDSFPGFEAALGRIAGGSLA